MPEAVYGQSNRWLTTLTVDPHQAKITPDEIMDALGEKDIESRPVWKPLHLQPVFKGCSYYTHKVGESISDRLFEQGLCLPSGTSMTEEEQGRVISVVKDCLRNHVKQGVSFFYGSKGGNNQFRSNPEVAGVISTN